MIAAVEKTRLPDADNAGGRPNDDSPDSESRLHTLLADLNRQSKGEPDTTPRRIARRVLEGEYIGLFERGMPLLQTQKRYEEAVRLFTLLTDIAPERAGGFYYLAWAYAAKGDRKKSLKALQTAVDKGFTDVAALAGNKAFDSMRDDPQFQSTINKMKTGH